jgi:hypothetical protein
MKFWILIFCEYIFEDFVEIGERLKLQEIEDAFSRFKICPKCNSKEGFGWDYLADKEAVHQI